MIFGCSELNIERNNYYCSTEIDFRLNLGFNRPIIRLISVSHFINIYEGGENKVPVSAACKELASQSAYLKIVLSFLKIARVQEYPHIYGSLLKHFYFVFQFLFDFPFVFLPCVQQS